MLDLSVKIGALTLKNPIMPASGTFSEDMENVVDMERLGAHVTKTLTREKRSGNPTPRVCEVQGAMLNSIGIPSKGIDAFKANIIPHYERFSSPLIVSISAGSADEFARLCEEISVPSVAAIEVNISCPNIEEDGKAFAMRPSSTEQVMSKLRSATDLPLWAKLTPNTGETTEVAKAAELAGADALVVCNTILAMAIDIRTRRPKLGNLMGGLSGPAFKPIALRMAYQCAKVVDIPVIGCGGITALDDVIEYLIAGSSAVQVGTANFLHPTIMTDMITGLEAYMREQGLTDLTQLIGSVQDEEASDGLVFMEAAP